jgi:hypothetical protein
MILFFLILLIPKSNYTKTMLSQSDLFNRLPISAEQKEQLFKALLSERRTTPLECPERNCPTHVEQVDPGLVGQEEAVCNLAPECFVPLDLSER